jgi:hypothetical protein
MGDVSAHPHQLGVRLPHDAGVTEETHEQRLEHRDVEERLVDVEDEDASAGASRHLVLRTGRRGLPVTLFRGGA